MEKIVIHKNKSEVFHLNFNVEGASADDVSVRLCLEFGDNKNLFFHGKVSKDGECTVTVPQLPELSNKNGRFIIEAIADSMYFKLVECDLEIKNSIEVKMTEVSREEPIRETRIELSEIKRSKPKKKSKPIIQETPKPIEEEPEIIEEEIEETPIVKPIEKFNVDNPYLAPKKFNNLSKIDERLSTIKAEVKEPVKETKKFSKFEQYMSTIRKEPEKVETPIKFAKFDEHMKQRLKKKL